MLRAGLMLCETAMPAASNGASQSGNSSQRFLSLFHFGCSPSKTDRHCCAGKSGLSQWAVWGCALPISLSKWSSRTVRSGDSEEQSASQMGTALAHTPGRSDLCVYFLRSLHPEPYGRTALAAPSMYPRNKTAPLLRVRRFPRSPFFVFRTRHATTGF
jgi:hypothetical protein